MFRKIAALVVSLIALPMAVNAAVIQLPKTGQSLCYDAAGTEVACDGTGQDGEKQLGVAWPQPRLVENGDGTVTDNLTGLVWLQNANCFDVVPWAEAFREASELSDGECGLVDGSAVGQWRLPNIKELQSLMDISGTRDALPAEHPFTGIAYSYWSSTTHAVYTASGWVAIHDGSVRSTPKEGSFHVWPVRNGQ